MLRFPRAFWLAALFAFALSTPGLAAGFFGDDMLMLLRLEHAVPNPGGLFDLYRFVQGSPGERDALVAVGAVPWWTPEGYRIAFFRPLASALYAFDFAVAGRHPLFYHLHSIAWYVTAVIAVGMLLRRLLPEREGALATILFAILPSHAMGAVWPAQRHMAICCITVAVALSLHVSAREAAAGGDKRAGRVREAGALLSTAIGLGFGEAALGTFAYLLAYEAFGNNEPRASRLRALLPWGALFSAYALVYKLSGYGVVGSGAYLDPASSPLAYLSALPTRLLALAASALLCLSADIVSAVPGLVPMQLGIGILGSFAFALLLRRGIRTLRESERRTLTWLVAGGGLSLLPGAAGFPGDRVLQVPNIGIVAALAVVILRGATPEHAGVSGRRVAKAGTFIFAFAHMILAPLAFVTVTAGLVRLANAASRVALEAELSARPGAQLIAVGLSDMVNGFYFPYELLFSGRPGPLPKVHRLAPSHRDHILKRTGDRTLEIAIVDGALLEREWEKLYRPKDAKLKAGDVEAIGPWIVRVLDTGSDGPTRFAITFDRSVDDASLGFITWRDGRVRAFAPPAVGEELRLAHETGPTGM